MILIVDVSVNVDDPMIVAALVSGNDTVEVIDPPWTKTRPADGSGR